jgi:hypothetical protein
MSEIASHGRHRWLLWTLLLLVAGASVSIIHSLRQPRIPKNWACDELASFLQARKSAWYIIGTSDYNQKNLSWGFYICDRPRELAELRLLLRCSNHIRDWQGVVFVEPQTYMSLVLDDDPRENSLVLGRYIFFGDPAILTAIEGLLSFTFAAIYKVGIFTHRSGGGRQSGE